MIRFSADVLGIPVLDRAFNRLDNVVSDFRPIWPFVATEFYAAEREQFNTEGAAGASGKWAPLSPAYKRWKEKNFPGLPILRLSNVLMDSLTTPDALDSVFIAEPQQLTIGTKAIQGLVHQRRGRPPISLSESQKRRVQKAIQRGLVQFTRQAGFQVQEAA